MSIDLNQISPGHHEQVARFLTCYPRTGQQLAENYLALVTSSKYQNSSGHKKKAKTETSRNSSAKKPWSAKHR